MYRTETSATATATLNTHEPAATFTDYGRALRAIGQDLTELFPKFLEINADGVSFEAHGQSYANPFQQIRERSFRRLWNKLFGKDSGTELMKPESTGVAFTRRYSPADIERLDQLYSADRTDRGQKPDNYSLAERLRTMGRIVESRKGRLKQLRKDADRLFVDYWDQDGRIQTAKLTTIILYRNPHHYPSRNGARTPEELWEGYDF